MKSGKMAMRVSNMDITHGSKYFFQLRPGRSAPLRNPEAPVQSVNPPGICPNSVTSPQQKKSPGNWDGLGQILGEIQHPNQRWGRKTLGEIQHPNAGKMRI